MSHVHRIRVYYEDTDLGGIVYYANYLRFIERARSEMLRAGDVDQAALLRDTGIGFVVRRVEADYLAPARYDDLLDVETATDRAPGRSSVVLRQTVRRDGAVLFAALVTLVAVRLSGDAPGRPVRLPEAVLAVFHQ